MVPDIFHRDFTPTPYWWEAYKPSADELVEVPRAARVAIVGGGYAGLSAALELAKHGIDAVVLEAGELGFGASTRNGGAVSGGVNIGKSFTGRAGDVGIATNGYTGALTPDLRRRVVPVASHIIATEPLPQDLARSLIPKGRSLSDTKRVLCYYRMSPDGRRMVFGGRARFTQVDATISAPVLHRYMTDRFPQLRGVKITHAWTGNVAFTL